MTMIAYAFLQHRRLATARWKKERAAVLSSAVRHASGAAMPALSKIDLQRAAA